MSYEWETEVAALLTELSAAQDDLFDVLAKKRSLLASADVAGLDALAEREHLLIARLQACQDRRAELLKHAAAQGLASDSIRTLTRNMTGAKRQELSAKVAQAASRARLLQHQSLTNWVITQRALIHLSQMLEIIATGGRPRPTYGKETANPNSGTLVDQAA